jgi:hypothetical protein
MLAKTHRFEVAQENKGFFMQLGHWQMHIERASKRHPNEPTVWKERQGRATVGRLFGFSWCFEDKCFVQSH